MSRSLRQTLGPWVPAGLYVGLIWLLSSMQQPPSTAAMPFADKGAHFVEYAVLAVLVCIGLAHGRSRPDLLRTGMRAVALTTFLGLVDEIHQTYVPYRSGDAMDLLADALGATAGALLFVAYRRQRTRAAS